MHPHVRAKDEPAREGHQQVLAVRKHALDHAASKRPVAIDTGESWKNEGEAADRTARGRSIERAGRPEDRVAFGH